MTFWYVVCIAGAAWMTFRASDSSGSPDRQVILVACALVYVARATLTFFVFMKRKIPWWEATWGGVSIGLVLFFFLRAGLRVPQPIGLVDILGILLYITGSYLGTASEYARHIWKARPENQGHLQILPPHQLFRRPAALSRAWYLDATGMGGYCAAAYGSEFYLHHHPGP
jgi:hypothetical protein